jgi:hypothetical protein
MRESRRLVLPRTSCFAVGIKILLLLPNTLRILSKCRYKQAPSKLNKLQKTRGVHHFSILLRYLLFLGIISLVLFQSLPVIGCISIIIIIII